MGEKGRGGRKGGRGRGWDYDGDGLVFLVWAGRNMGRGRVGGVGGMAGGMACPGTRTGTGTAPDTDQLDENVYPINTTRTQTKLKKSELLGLALLFFALAI